MGETVDGLTQEMDDFVFALQEQLLADDVGRSAVPEKPDGNYHDDHWWEEWWEIDLDYVGKCDYSPKHTLERVSQGVEEVIIDSPQIVGQSIDDYSWGGGVKEAAGAAD